ncbi:MAG TPA: hypothetical protein VMX75_01200 [Spirochaetia bacterium]|nr:hypothetical protein [Spirochaetia bacterium]
MVRRFWIGTLLSSLLFCCVCGFGETRTYRETTGEETLILTQRIEPVPEGYSVVQRAEKSGTLVIRARMTLDSDFATLAWEYSDSRKGIQLSAYRMGDVIVLTGRREGKRVDRKLQISSDPWFQAYPLSFEKFVVSGHKQRLYWSVNPSDTNAYDFSVTRRGVEEVTVNGRQEQASHLYITLRGFRSAFWHADSWHRISDGMYFRYEGASGGPGSPLTTSELILVE